jgi:hypothetical protein
MNSMVFLVSTPVFSRPCVSEKMNAGRTKLIGEARFNFAQEERICSYSCRREWSCCVKVRIILVLYGHWLLLLMVEGTPSWLCAVLTMQSFGSMLGELDKAGLLDSDSTLIKLSLINQMMISGKTVGEALGSLGLLTFDKGPCCSCTC